ncbi:N-6 DNA methylase [Dactylosporangium sp. NPDC051485]|uniref:N-6 DNA methylase n=1 Tax=Dactylosporangium sp. NPDC051485 TaxID=3154846 RepID=UPI003436B198
MPKPRPDQTSTTNSAQRAASAESVQRAWRIAEAVAAAWTRHHGTGTDLHIPVSVVAALSLCTRHDPDGPDPARLITQLDPAGTAALLRGIWRDFVTTRPDLAVRVTPLIGWLLDNPTDWQLDGAHTVATVAVRTRIMHLTDDADQRRNTDPLGAVLQTLRSRSSAAARGAFYTPQPVAEILAHCLIGEMLMAELAGVPHRRPGESILDPAAGTGAMLCGAARVLRAHGHDPTAYRWYANDIDPLAAACLAVNAHRWDLGTHVVIGCADGLDDAWIDRAVRDRNDGISSLRAARMIAALDHLTRPAADAA